MAKKRVIFEIDLPESYHDKMKTTFKKRKMKDAARTLLIALLDEKILFPESLLKYKNKA